MAYFVTCTFDLKGASATDYQNAYNDLATIGLKKTVATTSGQVVAPTTMTMGEFTGQTKEGVRDYVREKVRAAFVGRRFKSEIFVVVAEGWTWGSQAT